MRSLLALIVSALAFGGVAEAQAPARGATTEESKGYVEGVAQSAFGNVTSQSYGVELGVTITSGVQIFAEAGRIGNVATADITSSAQQIAAYLTPAGTVTYSVKQPATFVVAGVRYLFPTGSSAQPYVMGGFGMAKVEQKVAFLLNGSDITANLPQYGVTLGTDLSSDFTKPMLTIGGGVVWPAWRQMVIDFQYRYGRIMAEDAGITAQRAGIGVGVRF